MVEEVLTEDSRKMRKVRSEGQADSKSSSQGQESEQQRQRKPEVVMLELSCIGSL